MLLTIFLCLIACSMISGIIGIQRKQPIATSFILGIILGPIGILLVIFWPKPGIVEQEHINLTRIKEEKDFQSDEIITEFIKIVNSRIKNITLYMWVLCLSIAIALPCAIITGPYLVNIENPAPSVAIFFILIIELIAIPFFILSIGLYRQNVDSLFELLYGQGAKWAYRIFPDASPDNTVKFLKFFIVPLMLIKAAKEEIDKLNKQ